MISPRRGRGHGPHAFVYEPISRIDMRPHAVFFSLLALIMLLPASNIHTHALVIDLPTPGAPLDTTLSPPLDRIIVTVDDLVLWNGHPVTLAEFVTNLRWRLRQPELRQIVFDPQGGASYDLSLQVLALIEKSGNADAGFCFGDLSRYGRFGTEDREGSLVDPRGGFPCGRYALPPPPADVAPPLIPERHPLA